MTSRERPGGRTDMPKGPSAAPAAPSSAGGLPPAILVTVSIWVILYALAIVLPMRVSGLDPAVRFAVDLLTPPLILFACAVAGYAALDALKVRWLGPAERLILGTGLGLGALGLATFGLGLVGWTNMRAAPVVLLLAGAVRIPRLAAEMREWVGRAASTLRPVDWVMAGLAVALAATIVWAGWSPAIDYDEMEYHLALPKTYLEAGRIHEMPHNVYNYLPQGAEMLFQAAMSLRWAPEAPLYSVRFGGLLARTFNAYLAVLTALAASAVAGRLFGPRASPAAAALYLAMPWVYAVSYRAMAENAQVMFSTMAFMGLAVHWKERRPGVAALIGVMAGLALGVKYLVWGFVFAPAALWLAGEAVFLRPRGRGVRILAAFVAAALLAASPWLVRNIAWTGNPLHPLLTGLFGPGPYWTAAQAAHFTAHHSPQALGLAELVRALAPERLIDAVPVVLAILAGAVALVRPEVRKPALRRTGYVVIVLAVWWFGTHHVMRHLAPVWPPLAVLAAAGWVAAEGGRGRAVVRGICLAAAVAGLFVIAAKERDLAEQCLLRSLPAEQTGGTQFTYSPHAIDFLNLGKDLPGGAWADRAAGRATVGLVGEAETLELVRPALYHTVWDTPWLEPAVTAWQATGSADAVRRELARLGVGTVYVNWLEIGRFRGPGNYGWPAEINEALFDAWVRAGVLQEVAHFGVRAGPAHPWPHVIYRVVDAAR